MSSLGDPREDDDDRDELDVEDELPERIIVIREPLDAAGPDAAAAELEALAAEVSEGDGALADDDEVPTIDIDAPDDPEVLQAELDALAREVGAIDLDEVDLRTAPEPGPEPDPQPDQMELDALVAEVAASQTPDDVEEPSPFRWPDDDDADHRPAPTPLPAISAEELRWESASTEPRRDETGPGTLRPSVPEPVIAARTTSSPSRSRRTVSRMRSLLGLVFVVVLAGVGLAGAIGAAVLLVVLVLSRAFGSG